jgi:hypothetical protein
MQLSQKAKNGLKIFGVVVALFIVYIAWSGGYLDNTKVTESTTVGEINLPSAQMADNAFQKWQNYHSLQSRLATIKNSYMENGTNAMGISIWQFILANGGAKYN